MEKGTLMRVPPRGRAYTDPPSRLSQPATMSPACSMFCAKTRMDSFHGGSRPGIAAGSGQHEVGVGGRVGVQISAGL